MPYVETVAAAAVAVARQAGRDVGSLSLDEIAAAAGVSRSTLLRRVGSRTAIEAALRAQGVGPLSLNERVVAAAAAVIAAEGVASLTLNRVAADAGCTTMSIYNQFGNRDGLLVAVFEEHAVLPQLTPLLGRPGATVEELARVIYRRLLDVGLDRATVATALMIEAIARPGSALAAHLRTTYLPRSVAALDEFFAAHLGRRALRGQPREALLAQFLGPVQFYLELATLDRRPRSADERAAVAAALATNFAHAVGHIQEN